MVCLVVVQYLCRDDNLSLSSQKCCTQCSTRVIFHYICFSLSLNLTGIWSHIMKATNFHIIHVFAPLKFYFSSVQLLCCFFHVSSQGKHCRILAVIANKWLLGFVQIQILRTWVNWNKMNRDFLIQLVVVEDSNSQLTEACDHRNFCHFLTFLFFLFYCMIPANFISW